MRFGTLELQLESCEQHLDDAKARSSEIESYLVQYLLTRICAEYEARIGLLVQRRCSRMRDSHVRNFVRGGAKDVCRRFSVSDIKGILGRFGEDYKKTFHDRVVDKPPHVAWDNIYNNRQAVAHGGGAQMSFSDLKLNYKQSAAVLDALAVALDLRPGETADFK